MEEIKGKLRKQLSEYNSKVQESINERKLFLDKNMHVFAEFSIGEEVFNIQTYEVTKVKEHYRYHTNSNIFYDDSFDTCCRFENGDNTSRYGSFHPYVKVDDFKNKTQVYLRKLESITRYL